MREELRPFQSAALAVLATPADAASPVDLLCVSATGSGKSRIYETLARAPGARILLVTPLVALARQQQARLRALGIATHRSGDAGGPNATTAVWISSPESLIAPRRAEAIARWRPTCLVVDECHCLWEWGDGFRPAFAPLPDLLRAWRIPRSLWLTATLPPAARRELRARLGPSLVEQGSFELPVGLDLRVRRVAWCDRLERLVEHARSTRAAGLVFTNTRTSSERLARALTASGREAAAYHAGLSVEERRALETRFAQGGLSTLVATSAFGMGMDLRSIGWVLLWQAPPSPLALAQMIGRAGRNGAAAEATIYWDEDDFRQMSWLVGVSPRKGDDLVAVQTLLRSGDRLGVALQVWFSK